MDLNRMTTNQLKTYIANKGKRANTRLVALEKKGYESLPAYNYVSSKLAKRNVYTESTKKGNLKFTLSTRKLLKGVPQKNARNVLLEQATNIQDFLQAKTSTTSGVTDMYNKAYKSFSKDIDISFDEYTLFFKKGGFDKFDTTYISSDRIVYMIGKYGMDTILKMQSDELYNVKSVKEFEDIAKQIKEGRR